jgi:NAD(P)-dependent dehydrogenase (short-subunit alcohol dehydrogenase family)
MSGSGTIAKVALVTGGSRGIGFGVARELAEAGFRIAVNGRRPDSEVAGALAQLASAHGEALYCRGDVADLADHARMLDQVREHFGRLDVLVNNAGVAPSVRADLLEAGAESFDRLISINLRGPYFLTQAAAKWMVEQRKMDPAFRGCIVNVSSVSATVASVNRGDYCISKAGIAMATQLWAARNHRHRHDRWREGKIRCPDRRRADGRAAVGHAPRRWPGRRRPGPR